MAHAGCVTDGNKQDLVNRLARMDSGDTSRLDDDWIPFTPGDDSGLDSTQLMASETDWATCISIIKEKTPDFELPAAVDAQHDFAAIMLRLLRQAAVYARRETPAAPPVPAAAGLDNAAPANAPAPAAAPANPALADPVPEEAAPPAAAGPSAEQIGALVKSTIDSAIAQEKTKIQAQMDTLQRDDLDLTDAVNALSAHKSTPLAKEQAANSKHIRELNGLLQEAEEAAPLAKFPKLQSSLATAKNKRKLLAIVAAKEGEGSLDVWQHMQASSHFNKEAYEEYAAAETQMIADAKSKYKMNQMMQAAGSWPAATPQQQQYYGGGMGYQHGGGAGF